jgi:hypothetical protein
VNNTPITGTIRPTPQNPTLGAIAAALRKAQEFAGQYEVDKRIPLLGGTSVDELLGLPGAAREVQAWSYGDYPVRINPNAGRTASFVPEIKPGRKSDVADTLFLGADVTPLGVLAGKAVGRGARALEDATVGAAQRARVRAAAAQVPEDAAYAPLRQRMEERGNLAYAVKPEGNINLQPALRAEALRGPDVQPIDAFIAQAKSTPGVTQDALREILYQYEDIAPGTKISKADFESRIPPSKFSKVDLYNDPDKAINSPLDYHLEEARDRVMENSDHIWEAVVDRLGMSNFRGDEYSDVLDALYRYNNDEIGPEELPRRLREAMERDGLLQDRQMFDSLVQEQINDLVNETAYHMMQYDDTITTMSGYRYPEMQRLLPENVRNELSDNYFEFGVTHPDKADVSYRHYPNYESGEDGLVGHVRGTFIPADKTDAIAFVPSVGRGRAVIELKPKSVIIEEIQSDAQKGAFDAEQTGALRQVHGTLFKAAIDDALEKGATTVYYPTSRTIAQVRGGDPRPYASIYDQQIMREGLKPLGKIPGVTINPIEAMMPGAPGTTPKPVVAYYEINFTPEAKEYILNGPGQLAPGYAGGGIVRKIAESIGELAAKYGTKEAAEDVVKAAPKEHKMLQGVYRGYAGEDPGETVFHAGAEFQRPNPGLFTNPERAAVEKFQRFTGAPRIHTFEAKPRRTGTDEDVYAMAKRLGIYNPGIPASQYLDQGENAVFPEAARMVEELRGMGLDSLRLKDGMGKQPSLVALDPVVLQPAETVFASPQRRVAEYYAQKRAAQTGERPHVEMLLVDPFAGKKYGHSIPMDKFNREPVTTRARKLQPEQVKDRTKLYAAGGAVEFDPDEIAQMAEEAMSGYAAGGLVEYDPNEIDTIVSKMREAFHG